MHRVDLWFVAYGALDTVTEEGFLKDQVAQRGQTEGPESSAQVLTPEELEKRKLKIRSQDNLEERFVASQVNLFDRVLIDGTISPCRRARRSRWSWPASSIRDS